MWMLALQLVSLTLWLPGSSQASLCKETELDVRQGRLRGCHVTSRTNPRGFFSFTGIRYAEPPTGNQRFLPAKPLSGRQWVDGVLDARAPGAACPQLSQDNTVFLGSEDCLFLNVFTPPASPADRATPCTGREGTADHGHGCRDKSKAEGLPVMVYVHGGGFTRGSADPDTYGPDLLVAEEVIVVTLNYRLGVFGYFTLLNDTAPGNLGLRDIMLALDWVQQNIAVYGGDPDSVTVFGNSAGGASVSALLTVPAALAPTFHRAILQSGNMLSTRDSLFLQQVNRTTINLQFSEAAGCKTNVLSCLRGKGVEELVRVGQQFSSAWLLVLDGDLGNMAVMPQDHLTAFLSGQYKEVDIIIGSTDGDGLVEFGPFLQHPDEAYTRLQSNFSTAGPLLFLGKDDPDSADVVLSERLRYFYAGEGRMEAATADGPLVRLLTDSEFQAGGRQLVDIMYVRGQAHVYQYIFSYVGTKTNTQEWYGVSRPELGACHADELFYLFVNKNLETLVTEADKQVSQTLVQYWTQFARTGDPNSPTGAGVRWEAVSSTQPAYLALAGPQPQMDYPTQYAASHEFWRTVYFRPSALETPLGSIQGSYLTSVHGRCILAYQGVPYAQPPLASLRYLDPQPVSAWAPETLQANNLPPKCMQAAGSYTIEEEMSEDCLYLNIYTPCGQEAASHPVLFWIHGGGLVRGSGGTYFHGPEFLVDEEVVVVVTVNYRLAPFSFLSLETSQLPGNQGLKDQRLALQWVQQNIAAFGGNSAAVTLLGQSAGALSVVAHVSTPLSTGLFQRAVVQSPAGGVLRPIQSSSAGKLRATALALATSLGCKTTNDATILSCLQTKPAEDILTAASELPASNSTFFYLDDSALSLEPFFAMEPEVALRTGVFNRVPLIVGFTRDEGIVSTVPYILNETLVGLLEENWDQLGSEIIFGKCCLFTTDEITIAREIRRFYFGETGTVTVEGLIRLYTDLRYVVEAHRLTGLAAQLGTVFEYQFSHQGTFSFGSLLGVGEEYGVCHTDDLHYLFNPHLAQVEYPALGTPADLSVRDVMVKMWTGFARSSDPTPANSGLPFTWTQHVSQTPLYLEITEHPGMFYSKDFEERMNFWNGLVPLRPMVAGLGGHVFGSWAHSGDGQLYAAFRGLRYGRVVERFQEAALVEDYPRVLYAEQEGPICPQESGPYQVESGSGMSEDCLYLNIFVARQTADTRIALAADPLLPVMVWIHGGANIRGSGGQFWYGPQYLADYGDIVIVTINYRLGAFGFLSLETDQAAGNMALKDQNLALTWVQRHIADFGGNPEDVTLFGESAGSFSVFHQLISPWSAGLVHRAIAQSGAPFGTYLTVQPPKKSRRVAEALATRLGCSVSNDEALLTCLKAKSVEDILTHSSSFCASAEMCITAPWTPLVDFFMARPFLPDRPATLVAQGRHNRVPVLLGVNSEEGIYLAAKYIFQPALFSEINEEWATYGPRYIFDTDQPTVQEVEVARLVKEFYLGEKAASMDTIHSVIDIFSDIVFWAGAHRFALMAASQSQLIYTYQLTYKSANSYADLVLGLDSDSLGLGVCHADDIFILFKTHVYDLSFTEDDLIVRDKMATWWTNFAKNGSPDGESLWQPFTPSSPAYMNINPTPAMEYSDRYKERMDFWMEILDMLDK